MASINIKGNSNMCITSGNGKITLNGKTYSGSNIQIDGNKVVIDGANVDDTIGASITISGDIAKVVSKQSMMVDGDITGDIKASGSVNCHDINGSVTAGGSVNCMDIEGNVKAGGSINRR